VGQDTHRSQAKWRNTHRHQEHLHTTELCLRTLSRKRRSARNSSSMRDALCCTTGGTSIVRVNANASAPMSSRVPRATLVCARLRWSRSSEEVANDETTFEEEGGEEGGEEEEDGEEEEEEDKPEEGEDDGESAKESRESLRWLSGEWVR
jgi:hypothetical protein